MLHGGPYSFGTSLEVLVISSALRGTSTAALVVLAACGPKISEFSVTPRRVCAGDTVRFTFKTRGTAHLVAVRHGTATADTTEYHLVAEARGKQATSQADVVTFSPRAEPSLAFDVALLGQDSLVATDTLSPATWPDALRLGEVFADSGRVLLVRHAGKVDQVRPDEDGNASWEGLPVSGAWELRAGLLPGEAPGDPAHAPPRHLYLRVGLACGSADEGRP